MTQTTAEPRWKVDRFGDGWSLYLRRRWLGSVEPEIGGRCVYATPLGRGAVPTQAEAKRRVEELANDA